MSSKLKNWWLGKDRDYSTCNEPTPKEFFQIIAFVYTPYFALLYLIITKFKP